LRCWRSALLRSDTLTDRLRRRLAKPMGSPRGANPAGALRQPLAPGMPRHAVSSHLAAPAGPASARDPCAKGALSAGTQGLRAPARRWGCVHAGSADGASARVWVALGESAGGGKRLASSRFSLEKETHTRTTCLAWPSSVFEVSDACFQPTRFLHAFAVLQFYKRGRRVGV